MKGGKSSLKKVAAVLNVAIFCLLILAGCATKEAVKNVSDEDVLRERVTAYWSYRTKGELDKAYLYEDALTRKTMSLVIYMQKYTNPMIKYVSFGINDIKLTGDDIREIAGTLHISLKAPGAKALERDAGVIEQWVKEDGIWYHATKADNKFRQ